MPDFRCFNYRVMQKILGLVFIAVGMIGMAIYLSRGMMITSDEKIAMLLGFFMILIGIILIYSDRKKKSIMNKSRNPGN